MLPKENILCSPSGWWTVWLTSDRSKNTSCSCLGSKFQSDIYELCCPFWCNPDIDLDLGTSSWTAIEQCPLRLYFCNDLAEVGTTKTPSIKLLHPLLVSIVWRSKLITVGSLLFWINKADVAVVTVDEGLLREFLKHQMMVWRVIRIAGFSFCM